ncbi:hypothetical protein PVA45_01520 [Entomospira entomophila]|uniref:Uncharacterized protein n=2 Tax=Entomospira entomophila TaxID=2719988 RepID=A0A968GAQ1_9SPIO|nr:hypothetical protein [Entomospira entomophilus]NIZ40193.1 hypothetical protein [Entomospira entomophilus]WDI35752.1 hypothetical protein PVA45_01520 [Entomospira entomophilus]
MIMSPLFAHRESVHLLGDYAAGETMVTLEKLHITIEKMVLLDQVTADTSTLSVTIVVQNHTKANHILSLNGLSLFLDGKWFERYMKSEAHQHQHIAVVSGGEERIELQFTMTQEQWQYRRQLSLLYHETDPSNKDNVISYLELDMRTIENS